MSKKQVRHYKYQSPPPNGQMPFAIGTLDRPGSSARQDLPHSHSFFQILYVTGGSGRHFIDFDAYSFTPPAIYIIIPGQVHYYLLDAPLSGYVILFSEDFLLSNVNGHAQTYQLDFLLDNDRPPILQLNPDEATVTHKLVSDIYAEYIDSDLHHYATLQSYFNILLVKLQRMLISRGQKNEDNGLHPQLLQFKRLVSQHFLTERTIQFYAEQIGLNPNYLATLVKDLTGETPSQIIRRAVILEAKRLLVFHEQTIEQVSHQLQFKDPSYFGRFFKREVGLTPGAFRQYTLEKHQKN